MLSSPPRAFAAATTASAPASGSRSAVSSAAATSSSLSITVTPSEQSRKRSPCLTGDRERLDLDGRLGPERPGDRGALRVSLGLLGCEDATLDELGDERVIGRELLEDTVSQQICARVSDVADRDGSPLRVDQGSRHRRSHPGGCGICERALPDAPVGLDDKRLHALLAARLVSCFFLECPGRQARCDLTGASPAHAVGDGEQRRLADEGILVSKPSAPRVGETRCAADPHRCTSSSVSPMRTTSPGRRSRAAFRRAPLT